MRTSARDWFARHTHSYRDYPIADLLAAKRQTGTSVNVVIPARNEAGTIGPIVAALSHDLIDTAALVDELYVVDSLSVDDTAEVARAHGATVIDVRDVVGEIAVGPGKGEAMWRSLFATDAEVLVFIDADLTQWGTHFVAGLLGPLLSDEKTQLVKGFYDRPTDETGQHGHGGRVTELLARPLLARRWPDLAAVVQPLSGEWAVRRSLIQTLPIPVGYGVEFAVLVDTYRAVGLDAIAQVDLGTRAHQSQPLLDLGVMAAEILAVAARRSDSAQPVDTTDDATLAQYRREGGWHERPVPTLERPPAITISRSDHD